MYKYINIYSLRENLIVRAPNVCLLGLLVLINQLLRSKPQIFATIKERKKERKKNNSRSKTCMEKSRFNLTSRKKLKDK